MYGLSGSPRVWIVSATLLIGIAGVAFFNPAPLKTPPSPALHPSHHPAVASKPVVDKADAAALPHNSAFDMEQRMTTGQRINRWNRLIAEASRRFSVPQPWIRAVLVTESGGRTMAGENQPLVSSAGAMGLMQLMPDTYRDMRAQYGLGADPQDPHDNIFAGAAFLRRLFLTYGYPAMFAAYNDGPGNLADRLLHGELLPEETRRYAADITKALAGGIGLHGVKTKFTRPDGTPVWIDAAAVASVRAALPGEYAPGVLSVITVGKIHQGVRENVVSAKAILRAHGGGL
ncbi:MAG: lytic transglycosylase domain-containing protein [Rhizomicrobium sp.]